MNGELLLVALTAVGVAALAVGGAAIAVAWFDARDSRGEVLDEGAVGGLPLRAASSSSAPADGGNACECGRLHPPEALPLELLLNVGVAVSVSRWFGRPVA